MIEKFLFILIYLLDMKVNTTIAINRTTENKLDLAIIFTWKLISKLKSSNFFFYIFFFLFQNLNFKN
jgi:hypothetical protein